MYWQETAKHEIPVVTGDVTDIAYQIRCQTLPVDHAWALSQAVQAVLPWLESEPGAGVHVIHVADSGNGWMRPQGGDDLLYLSRRTRLHVRVPRHRIDDAMRLVGRELDVAGHPMSIDKAALKPLSTQTTIFARYVVSAAGQDENAFLAAQVRELEGMGVAPRKMLCGIERLLATPDGPLHTRSLMIAELTSAESARVQQLGLGPLRILGCGLFLPHKGIKELNPQQAE
jgi:CRISPR-associated protein Cas6